jgi:ribonucleoside-diphosphate reductase alpha chain
VERAYLLAWELGCKGITVYRAGSREAEVLTAGADDGAKRKAEGSAAPGRTGLLVERQRPPVVRGITERVRTAHGNLFVTVNYDDDGRPFEVFAALGKAGSTESAQLDAIARLVSMSLRAGVDPNQIIDHLKGITDEPVWDSGRLVRSAPDAVALVLSRHLRDEPAKVAQTETPEDPGSAQPALFQLARPQGPTENGSATNGHSRGPRAKCPDCQGALIYQEGCARCLDCGYNRCE